MDRRTYLKVAPAGISSDVEDVIPKLKHEIKIDGDYSDWVDQSYSIYKNGPKELWMLKDDLNGYFLFRDPDKKQMTKGYYANLGVRPINPSLAEDKDHPPFLICFNLLRKIRNEKPNSSFTYWDYSKKKWVDVSGYMMHYCREIPDELWAIRCDSDGTTVELKYPLRGDEDKKLPPIVINDQGVAGLYASIEPMGPDKYPIFKNYVFNPMTFQNVVIPQFSNAFVALTAALFSVAIIIAFRKKRMDEKREMLNEE